MAIFRREDIEKIRTGRKTMTRRIHKREWRVGRTYMVRDSPYSRSRLRIRILRKFRQKLGEISEEDIRKEGYSSLEEFKEVWTRIYGEWNPEQVVTAYEFEVVEGGDPSRKPADPQATKKRF